MSDYRHLENEVFQASDLAKKDTEYRILVYISRGITDIYIRDIDGNISVLENAQYYELTNSDTQYVITVRGTNYKVMLDIATLKDVVVKCNVNAYGKGCL